MIGEVETSQADQDLRVLEDFLVGNRDLLIGCAEHVDFPRPSGTANFRTSGRRSRRARQPQASDLRRTLSHIGSLCSWLIA
jgi:hypothetical protein